MHILLLFYDPVVAIIEIFKRNSVFLIIILKNTVHHPHFTIDEIIAMLCNLIIFYMFKSESIIIQILIYIAVARFVNGYYTGNAALPVIAYIKLFYYMAY